RPGRARRPARVGEAVEIRILAAFVEEELLLVPGGIRERPRRVFERRALVAFRSDRLELLRNVNADRVDEEDLLALRPQLGRVELPRPAGKSLRLEGALVVLLEEVDPLLELRLRKAPCLPLGRVAERANPRLRDQPENRDDERGEDRDREDELEERKRSITPRSRARSPRIGAPCCTAEPTSILNPRNHRSSL